MEKGIRTPKRGSVKEIKSVVFGLVIVTLLIVGGVEQNPGPLSEREEKEIFNS
jgi:hypothetical protein